jgi:hypothetical protein
MPATDPGQRRLNAQHAADARWNRQTEDVLDRRRQFKADQLEAHIKRVVDAAPPLTSEQRDRLALLLRGGAA